MDAKLPKPGTKVKCICNTDRPELVLGQVYTVVYFPDLDKCPINYARFQPDDYRLLAVAIPGQRECGIFSNGLFEPVVKEGK